ncbi:multidrug effflux MFS transporter [Rhodococcus opacus]|uniref:multidrug effflux MFS transporter n=1 Tax=Rhodococcus opacus TaxID=37919 RepID=UPI001C4801B7|nr:multidrug effflux MFS transporter [Rhodococcus opacus]MBV6756713.1 multidrug effflux MFS transporter [Rhodococcus opacus]
MSSPEAPPVAHHPTAAAPVARTLAFTLGLLTIFGPISMDAYLPTLPALTFDLGATTSTAQATLTACLLGLAVGQVIAGPLSDRFGRRRPLLTGVVAYTVTSLLCAVSPTIETLIAARFAQGLAGAVGLVLAQAAGRDIYSGGKLVRFYGRLTMLAGLAAIVGPTIGGQLARVTSWRGIFFALSAIGVALLIICWIVFVETLPEDRRVSGGVGRTRDDMRRLLRDRTFVGAVLVAGFVSAALFGYLGGATYVLQEIYGLSPQGYALVFGCNSVAFVFFGFVAGRLSEKWSERKTLAAGLALCFIGAVGTLVTGVLELPLSAIIGSLFVMSCGVATTKPPAASIALTGYPDIAGTASSLLGLTRFALGGLAAPLVGLGGSHTAVPLGIVTATAMTLACITFAAFARHRPEVAASGPDWDDLATEGPTKGA